LRGLPFPFGDYFFRLPPLLLGPDDRLLPELALRFGAARLLPERCRGAGLGFDGCGFAARLGAVLGLDGPVLDRVLLEPLERDAEGLAALELSFFGFG